MWNVQLKTLNYFCFPVYELPFLTQFSHIAPTGPNTFLNRYNLTLRWYWHFSMVLLDVKYVKYIKTELLLVFPSPWFRVLGPSFSKIAIMPEMLKNRLWMALRIWVRTCWKVNHGVGDFGLLFMCPSLDFLFFPNCPIVPSTIEQIKIYPQIALFLD